MRERLRILLSVLALGMLNSWSFAYGATAITDSAPSEASLQEIIVTATRREENLQKTPLAITVVSGDVLKTASIDQISDLYKVAPGLSVAATGSNPQEYLRGIGTFSVTSYADSSVAFNVDQVFMGFPGEINGTLYDIQRVEVLHGPQGTLYGRNATAGAINIISNKPTFNGQSGEFSVEGGNYDLVKVNGALNEPLDDQLAIRAAFQVVHRAGYFTDGYGDDKSQSIRLQTLYRPSDVLSILVGLDYVRVHEQGDAETLYYGSGKFADPGHPFLGPSTPLVNQALAGGGLFFPGALSLVKGDGHANSNSYGLHAQVDWDLGFATLTAIPAFRHLSTRDDDYPGFYAGTRAAAYQTSGELRLTSAKAGPLTWIAGAYTYYDKDRAFEPVDQGFPATGYLAPTEIVSSHAAFGDVTLNATDALHFTGGLRYTNETRDQNGNSYLVSTGVPHVTPSNYYEGRATFNNVSYKVGVSYDVTPTSLLYANVGTGFRAGGFNTEPAPNAYQPEKITAYSLGSKNRFFEGRLQINAELFDYDLKNHQELVLGTATDGSTTTLTRNIQKATSRGVDLDIKVQATPADLFSALIEYNHTKYDNFTYIDPLPAPALTGSTSCTRTGLTFNPVNFSGSSLIDCSGKAFTHAPEWTANLGYQHTFRLPDTSSIVAAVNTQLATAQYVTTDFIDSDKQPFYEITDVNLTWSARNDAWSVTAYVHNISNETVINGGVEQPYLTGGATYVGLRPPRTFGAIVTVKFH